MEPLIIVVLFFISVWNLFISIAAGSIVYQWCMDKRQAKQEPDIPPGVYEEITDENGNKKLVPVQEKDNEPSEEELDRWILEGLNATLARGKVGRSG